MGGASSNRPNGNRDIAGLIERQRVLTPTALSKKREKVREIFNRAAQSLSEHAEPVYDEHMAEHNRVGYQILSDIKDEAVPKHVKTSLKERGMSFKMLVGGPGTAKLEFFLFIETLFSYIQTGGAVDVVLVDPAEAMLEVARRKFENKKIVLAPEDQERFGIHVINEPLEDVRTLAVLNKYPILADNSFSLAFCSYLVNWLGSEARQAYTNILHLLAPARKLITIEEWNLIVTPSMSVPEGLEEALNDMDQKISPEALYSMLSEIGLSSYGSLDRGRLINAGTDYEHTMHYAIFQKPR